MDRVDEIYKERIQALLRAMNATRYIKDDRVPCQIEEGLYLGSLGAANNKSALKSLNITHVLTVACSLSPPHPNDFVYKIVNVVDREDTNLAQYFDECFNFIDEAKSTGGVLVHCVVGKSRSVTIVLAYMMKKHGMSLSDALEHVKSKRPIAGPNSGFMTQLQNLEKSIREAKQVLSRQMAKGDQASIIGGVIEFIKELHMVLQSLESKKRRKSLSPSPGPSPKPLQPSPRSADSPFGFDNIKELAACCNSPIADVEAKISGANLILRTVSRKTPGQVVKIISVLEKLSFEILHLNISSMEDTVLYSFVIKIGLECQLSVEELVVEVQQSFSSDGVFANKS